MIHPGHLRQFVIRPTLEHLGLWSESAENLVFGTIAQESVIGNVHYLKQQVGPALGIGQVEPATHEDNWINYLRYRMGERKIGSRVARFVPDWAWDTGNLIDGFKIPSHLLLITSLEYNVAQCRIKYFRVPEKLPHHEDLEGLACYWDEYYNANPQHGFPNDWVSAYLRARELEVSLD